MVRTGDIIYQICFPIHSFCRYRYFSVQIKIFSPSNSNMNKAVTNASSTSTLLGHQSRCFDVRFNFDSQLFISSSEDGSSKLWNLQQKKCLNTLIHNKEAEVLRSCFLNKSNSLICTGGSDATAIIWKKEGNKYNKVEKLKHTDESQVYVCESFCHPLNQFTDSLLLTAADNKLYIWDCEGNLQQPYIWTFESTESDPSARFGGARNEQNLAFIFDAKICPLSEDLICVALSDSTIRLVDKREHNHDQHMTLFNYNKLLPGNSQNQSTAVSAFYFISIVLSEYVHWFDFMFYFN